MEAARVLGFCAAMALLGFPVAGRAQDDASGDDLQVVSAVYGWNDHFEDVTAQVGRLLGEGSFFAHPDDLHAQAAPSDENTLIIVYNYDGKRHFLYRRSVQNKISAGLLKEEAKLDDSHALAAPLQADPGGDLKVIFAIYGLRANFAEVTDTVTKLLRDSAGITLPGAGSYGVDPAGGGPKYTVLIYDEDGARHIYATKDDGPPITLELLSAKAKASK